MSSGSVEAHRLGGGAEGNPGGELVPVRDRVRRRCTDCRLCGDAGDRGRRRVPEADDAGPVGQENALAHMGEHLVRVRAGLDLCVQAGVVDRDRDHPGNGAAPGEIGALVQTGALAGHECERPERPAYRLRRAADACGSPKAPAGDSGSPRGLRGQGRGRLGRRRRKVAAGHCVPGEAAVVRHVHDAPLGEVRGSQAPLPLPPSS